MRSRPRPSLPTPLRTHDVKPVWRIHDAKKKSRSLASPFWAGAALLTQATRPTNRPADPRHRGEQAAGVESQVATLLDGERPTRCPVPPGRSASSVSLSPHDGRLTSVRRKPQEGVAQTLDELHDVVTEVRLVASERAGSIVAKSAPRARDQVSEQTGTSRIRHRKRDMREQSLEVGAGGAGMNLDPLEEWRSRRVTSRA
jgi:hypothetical protein